MNEPKKVNLLGLKKEKENVANVNEVEKKEENLENRADAILEKYKDREIEYNKIGAKRADEDKKRKDEWKKKDTGYFRTSLFITLNDNDDYEDIRKKSRGTLRLGYRHIFHYGLKQLKNLSPDEAVKILLEIDEEFKKSGIVIKE